jgi:hypothetical protein
MPDYSDTGCLYLHKTNQDLFGLSCHLRLINQTFVPFRAIGWPNLDMDYLCQHEIAEGTPDCFALLSHLSLIYQILVAIPAIDRPRDFVVADMDLMIICIISANLAC